MSPVIEVGWPEDATTNLGTVTLTVPQTAPPASTYRIWPVVALGPGQTATVQAWSGINGEPWQTLGVFGDTNPPPTAGIQLATSAVPGFRWHRIVYAGPCGTTGDHPDDWKITRWGPNTGDCPPRPPSSGGTSANPPAQFSVYGGVPFDCTKPTALIVHGWMSGPDAAWIRCLAEEVQRRGQNGYNVLIADASRYMSATEAIFNSGAFAQAALDASEGAVRGGLASSVREAAVGLALEALIGPRNNIDRAGIELSESARCSVPSSCATRPPIDLIIGHSFGGAIGAKIANEFQRSGGPAPQRIPTLVTIDTPWTMLGAREVDLRAYADMAARSTVKHINYFSTCPLTGGFGSPLPDGPGRNVVNFVANASGANQTARCTGVIDHACLASQACDLLRVSLNGLQAAPSGTYQEGPAQHSFVAGGSPTCLGSVLSWFGDGLVSLSDRLGQGLFGIGTTYDAPNDVRTLQVIPGEDWALATGPFIVPAQAGHLYFQYRRVGMPPDQEATVQIDGEPRWSTLGPEPTAPPEDWQTALVPLLDRAGTTSTLTLQLTPPTNVGGGGGAGGTIEFRAIKIVPLAGVACTAAPAITQQPTLTSNCRATVLSVATSGTLGTSYFWRRNGQDLRDGALPGGAVVTGSRGPILLLTGLSAADAGSFDVVVRNTCGTTTSTPVNVIPPCTNRGDIAGRDQTPGCDGLFTADDIIVFLSWFFASDTRADFAGPNQSPTPDAAFTADDIIVFLSLYFAGC